MTDFPASTTSNATSRTTPVVADADPERSASARSLPVIDQWLAQGRRAPPSAAFSSASSLSFGQDPPFKATVWDEPVRNNDDTVHAGNTLAAPTTTAPSSLSSLFQPPPSAAAAETNRPPPPPPHAANQGRDPSLPTAPAPSLPLPTNLPPPSWELAAAPSAFPEPPPPALPKPRPTSTLLTKPASVGRGRHHHQRMVSWGHDLVGPPLPNPSSNLSGERVAAADGEGEGSSVNTGTSSLTMNMIRPTRAAAADFAAPSTDPYGGHPSTDPTPSRAASSQPPQSQPPPPRPLPPSTWTTYPGPLSRQRSQASSGGSGSGHSRPLPPPSSSRSYYAYTEPPVGVGAADGDAISRGWSPGSSASNHTGGGGHEAPTRPFDNASRGGDDGSYHRHRRMGTHGDNGTLPPLPQSQSHHHLLHHHTTPPPYPPRPRVVSRLTTVSPPSHAVVTLDDVIRSGPLETEAETNILKALDERREAEAAQVVEQRRQQQMQQQQQLVQQQQLMQQQQPPPPSLRARADTGTTSRGTKGDHRSRLRRETTISYSSSAEQDATNRDLEPLVPPRASTERLTLSRGCSVRPSATEKSTPVTITSVPRPQSILNHRRNQTVDVRLQGLTSALAAQHQYAVALWPPAVPVTVATTPTHDGGGTVGAPESIPTYESALQSPSSIPAVSVDPSSARPSEETTLSSIKDGATAGSSSDVKLSPRHRNSVRNN